MLFSLVQKCKYCVLRYMHKFIFYLNKYSLASAAANNDPHTAITLMAPKNNRN